MLAWRLATAALILSWIVLGAALLAARWRSRAAAAATAITPDAGPAPEPASATRRDLTSWLGIGLQAIGFSLAWGWRRGDGVALLPTAAPLLDGVIAVAVIVLAGASAAFALAAIRELGKQWSLTARVLASHELITSGPFAVVRHPIYSALLGLLLATGLCLATPAGIALGTVCYLLGTTFRASREERLLRATFGQAYLDYEQRVPRLIPGLRRPHAT